MPKISQRQQSKYLNTKDTAYKEQIRKFKSRTFLLPENQDFSNEKQFSPSEKVVMLLKHTCYQCRVPPHNEHPTYFGDKIMHRYNKMTT